MAHVCNQIKKAVVSIVTGLTTTTTNVFEARKYPLGQSILPGLCVYTNKETIDLGLSTLDAPMRLLEVVIFGVAEETAGLDDKLDLILKEVEVAMGADITIGGLAIGLDLSSWEKKDDVTGEKPVGTIEINYIVQYRTPFGSPETVA